MNKNETCTHCGTTPVYAKGLCKNCYTRNIRRGTTNYKEIPHVGELINGWLVVDRKPKNNTVDAHNDYLCVCQTCGKQKYFPYYKIYEKNIKSCVCHYNDLKNLKKTEKQQKIVDVFLNCDRNYNETAKALGYSRQYIYATVRRLKRKLNSKELL